MKWRKKRRANKRQSPHSPNPCCCVCRS